LKLDTYMIFFMGNYEDKDDSRKKISFSFKIN
jgi:hypothetical protein